MRLIPIPVFSFGFFKLLGSEKIAQTEFDHGGRGIGGAVVNKQSFIVFDGAGRKHHVGHEAGAFILGLGSEDAFALYENASWVFQIKQQDAVGVNADAGFTLALVVAVVNLEPGPDKAKGGKYLISACTRSCRSNR
ncbi:MAG TPA: hypothetical protein VIT21_05610 [Chthoniobacterales bacterium]